VKPGPLLVTTPDLRPSEAFYGGILNLPLNRRSNDQLIFQVGTLALHVFRCESPTSADVRHGLSASSTITFEVVSIEAEMQHLRGCGAQFLHERPAENTLAGLAYAAFLAPGGNVHELVERR
jgi:catechol 2,3-dioxygenase-like lactoylglutathione lyase family enzyme